MPGAIFASIRSDLAGVFFGWLTFGLSFFDLLEGAYKAGQFVVLVFTLILTYRLICKTGLEIKNLRKNAAQPKD